MEIYALCNFIYWYCKVKCSDCMAIMVGWENYFWTPADKLLCEAVNTLNWFFWMIWNMATVLKIPYSWFESDDWTSEELISKSIILYDYEWS